MRIEAKYNMSYNYGEISVSEGNTQIVVDWMNKQDSEDVAKQLLRAYHDLTDYSLGDKLDWIEDAFSDYVDEGDTETLQEVQRKIEQLRKELDA